MYRDSSSEMKWVDCVSRRNWLWQFWRSACQLFVFWTREWTIFFLWDGVKAFRYCALRFHWLNLGNRSASKRNAKEPVPRDSTPNIVSPKEGIPLLRIAVFSPALIVANISDQDRGQQSEPWGYRGNETSRKYVLKLILRPFFIGTKKQRLSKHDTIEDFYVEETEEDALSESVDFILSKRSSSTFPSCTLLC